MIVFVTGSREGITKEQTFKALDKIFFEELNKYPPLTSFEVIHGGAKGVDSFTQEWCVLHNIKVTPYPPEYKKYGRGAPFVRNLEMAKACDLCVAIWDGQSHGTKDSFDKVRKLGKPLRMFIFAKNVKKIVGIQI